MEQNSNIFISYRREDTSGYAGRLHDALSLHFGSDRVFMDVDSIGYGVDFVEVVENAVSSCEILIAVIGKHWVDITDKKGQRRLDNPQDLVRVEIATALKRGIKVIPAIVQDAIMPTEDVLPEPLAKLARRNAIEISDSRWKFDVERLIAAIEQELNRESAGQINPAKAEEPEASRAPVAETRRKPSTQTRSGWLKIALIAVFMFALIGIAWVVIVPYLTGSRRNQNVPSNNNVPNSNNSNTAEPAVLTKYYEGFINNREQLTLRLHRREQILYGTISNITTRRLNIQIKGSIDNAQNIVLQELDEHGIETGIYRGKLVDGRIDGTWTSPNGGTKIPFYLKEVS
ncbi:MAG TPA: toll/interleukin-1 receptor domain-containing protein [Pyrinomonadaceae bacterium]|jgi:hypothetical protein